MQECSSHKYNAFIFIQLVWQLDTYFVLDPTRKLYNHKQINHSLKLVQCIFNHNVCVSQNDKYYCFNKIFITD